MLQHFKNFWCPNRRDITQNERTLLAIGKLLARQSCSTKQIAKLSDVEFSVFSQWGDDGIIQWLSAEIELNRGRFIEFGVGDYRESNTRFLLINNNWTGLVLDGSSDNIARIRQAEYYWRHELHALHAFVDCDNINSFISEAGFNDEIDLLHIDIDGNDYWIWKSLSCIRPKIVIVEYNAVFGHERAITIPYDPAFKRTEAHFTNLYFGTSLSALIHLGEQRDYQFIGCNSAGNNAYFVAHQHLTSQLAQLAKTALFVSSRFRESRDNQGQLSFLAGESRAKAIRDLPVYNVLTEQIEPL